MKERYVLLLLFSVAIACCKKDKKSTPTCNGYFAGQMPAWSGSGRPRLSLAVVVPELYGPLNLVAESYTWRNINSAYNNSTKVYYYFSNSYDGFTLEGYDFNEGATQPKPIHYTGSMDSFGTSPPAVELFCNSTSGELYYVYYDNWEDGITDKIYRLNIHADSCTETLLYTAPHDVTIGSPVVDEHTGFLYFVDNNELVKIAPSLSATPEYINLGDVKPYYLQFSTVDGMFYAIDSANTPNQFIRINPANGNTTVLSELNFHDTAFIVDYAFDKCSQQYIIVTRSTIATYEYGFLYLELSTGEIAKRENDIYRVHELAYINN